MQSPSLNLISEPQLQALLDNQIVVWDDFLAVPLAEKLLQMAHQWREQNLFTPASIGHGARTHRAESIRSDFTYWLNAELAPEIQQIFLRLEEFRSELNQKLFWGLTHFECHLAHYAPGQGYQEHLDQSPRQSFLDGERKISFVLYLNKHWQKDDGGELRTGSAAITPLFNRLVFFRSDTVLHSVAPTNKDRWSLTGWMRRS